MNSCAKFEVFAKYARSSLHVHLPEIKEAIVAGLDKAKEAHDFKHVGYTAAFKVKCTQSADKNWHAAHVHEKQ